MGLLKAVYCGYSFERKTFKVSRSWDSDEIFSSDFHFWTQTGKAVQFFLWTRDENQFRKKTRTTWSEKVFRIQQFSELPMRFILANLLKTLFVGQVVDSLSSFLFQVTNRPDRLRETFTTQLVTRTIETQIKRKIADSLTWKTPLIPIFNFQSTLFLAPAGRKGPDRGPRRRGHLLGNREGQRSTRRLPGHR